jgi:hypothetical protein
MEDDSTAKGHYEGPHYDAVGPSDFDDYWDSIDEDESRRQVLRNLRNVDLREVASIALKDAEAALPTWETVKDAPLRQAHALDDSLPGEDAEPVRLQDGRTVWVQLTDEGARLFTEPLRSHRPILAALCTAGMTQVEHTGRGDAERLWRAARVYVLLSRKGLAEPFDLSRILNEARNDQQISSIGGPALYDAWKLDSIDALIRHYRPGYVVLPEEEQVALLVETAKRVDTMLSAVRGLQIFLEEGDAAGSSKQRPRGDRYKNADPQRDVRAAELRDALGLKHREIAAVLEFPLPESHRVMGKIPAVKNAIGRGRGLLKQVLPDEDKYELYLKRVETPLRGWYEYVSGETARNFNARNFNN